MPRQVALLRGINVGRHKRIAMADLRRLLSDAGYAAVRTHLQSGNVVLASDEAPERLAEALERQIADGLGVDVGVVVRTGEDLAEVVARAPLADVADNPKLHHVVFLGGDPDPERVAELEQLARGEERIVVSGREIFAWHPDGVRGSALARALSSPRLGPVATARNWNTVVKLLELASEE